MSSASPNGGTVIDISTTATDGRYPGTFKPYVLAMLNIDDLC
jgi:hypothetical protein